MLTKNIHLLFGYTSNILHMTSTESIKERSEEYLRKLGIEVNTTLPYIEPLDEVSPRTPVEVAKMLVVLSYMIRVGYGFPIKDARERLAKIGADEVLGSTASEILNTGKLSEQQQIDLRCTSLYTSPAACRWRPKFLFTFNKLAQHL